MKLDPVIILMFQLETIQFIPRTALIHIKKIQCKIVDTSGTRVCVNAYYILNENSTSNTKIPIRDGYLSTTPVYFKFRGNSDAEAYAIVSYYGN